MAERDAYRLSSPLVFLVRVLIFLALVGFVALVLYKQIQIAFSANPGLNGLILGVLAIGILLALRQIGRLIPEVRWVNSLREGKIDGLRTPVLLAPMATLLGDRAAGRRISTITLRAILDSIGTRLDESRETARYLTGLLVFLGLLGTFWGLLETVGSIGAVISSMQTGGDPTLMFDDLKAGLSKPIAGMSISFTSSLFGLAGSLVLGFLDLQAGQAQNRFYTQLEDLLSADADDPVMAGGSLIPGNVQDALERIAAGDTINSPKTSDALANLAEGIQSIVAQMRNEQNLIRHWVESQAFQQSELQKLLERLSREHERP